MLRDGIVHPAALPQAVLTAGEAALIIRQWCARRHPTDGDARGWPRSPAT